MPPPLDRRQFLNVSGSARRCIAPSCHRPRREPDAKPKGLVIGQPQAAEAGNAMLAAGSNAVDAAVAAALVAAVVSVHNTGIGGYGGHLVVARPDGTVAAIDFNTTAPAALKPDTFAVDAKGNVKGDTNTYGYLAAGVPGVLAGLQLALDRFGTQGFASVVKPAIRYARDGFPIDRGLANATKGAQERFSRDPASARIFYPAGEPLAAGATLRNPDLADMLQTLAKRGNVATFYKGDIADRIAAAFRRNGGLVTVDDLAAYRALEVKPLAIDFQGHRLFTPPPTAGGLTTLQALATLQALGWPKWDASDPASTQARVEALRIAWNDRLRYLGDPRKVVVPVERLLSEAYAIERGPRSRGGEGEQAAGRRLGWPAVRRHCSPERDGCHGNGRSDHADPRKLLRHPGDGGWAGPRTRARDVPIRPAAGPRQFTRAGQAAARQHVPNGGPAPGQAGAGTWGSRWPSDHQHAVRCVGISARAGHAPGGSSEGAATAQRGRSYPYVGSGLAGRGEGSPQGRRL